MQPFPNLEAFIPCLSGCLPKAEEREGASRNRANALANAVTPPKRDLDRRCQEVGVPGIHQLFDGAIADFTRILRERAAVIAGGIGTLEWELTTRLVENEDGTIRFTPERKYRVTLTSEHSTHRDQQRYAPVVIHVSPTDMTLKCLGVELAIPSDPTELERGCDRISQILVDQLATQTPAHP